MNWFPLLGVLTLTLTLSGLAAADDWPHAKNTQKPGEHPAGSVAQIEKMTLPKGFNVTLFASEPEVRQPVAFTFDDRGRLWVLECYTYTGKKKYDDTKRDRIVIFEDTDGDGRFNHRKVFWEEGFRAFGIEWGHGGVWVAQAPYLSFIPDRNGDDLPDGPPEHKVDGFTTEASHNNVNGLRWGPDGWLWGRHGMLSPSRAAVTGTPIEARARFKACIWRYHPVLEKFELVCSGGINPWGFDWNEVGEMFFTNNVNGQLFHLIPGARYRVNFIPPHDAPNQPFLEQCADHQHWDYGVVWHQGRSGATTDQLGGGHSHCGGMIYLGDNWPKEYRGRVFMHNIHGKRVNQEILARRGSGYVATHGVDFLKANTEWFRGVELKYGPDGGVYLLDWCDYGECHDSDGVHRTSGRIYKVTHGEPGEHTSFDLREFTDAQLVELQLFENDWWVRQARRILQERAIAKSLDTETVRADLLRIYRHPDVTRRLRAFWCLYSTGLIDRDWIKVQLRDENEHIRAWALRLLADRGLEYGRVSLIFGRMARHDPSALVRVHLASVMQKIPIGRRLEVLVPLAQHPEDTGDPNLPLMIWFAAEESIARSPELAIELACTTPHRLTRRLVARKIAAERERRPASLERLVAALGETDDDAVQSDLLEGMLDALTGSKAIAAPESWATAYSSLSARQSAVVSGKLAQLAVVFSDPDALEQFRKTASDSEADPAVRRRALEVLVMAGAEGINELLDRALDEPALVIPALRGLAASPRANTADRILKRYPDLEPEQSRVALSLLASRREFALALLDAVASGIVPATDLSAFDARQIQSLGDRNLHARLQALWGSVQETSAGKKQEITKLRTILSVPATNPTDRIAGRRIFDQRCAACHTLWGSGGQAGPNLTGSDRKNLDYLLENIVDPSASVPQNYLLTLVELKNGQVLGGFVEEDLGSSIRLRTQDRMHSIGRDRIAKRQTLKTSLMPEGILNGLSDDELRHLFAYLRGEEQVALP